MTDFHAASGPEGPRRLRQHGWVVRVMLKICRVGRNPESDVRHRPARGSKVTSSHRPDESVVRPVIAASDTALEGRIFHLVLCPGPPSGCLLPSMQVVHSLFMFFDWSPGGIPLCVRLSDGLGGETCRN